MHLHVGLDLFGLVNGIHGLWGGWFAVTKRKKYISINNIIIN